MKHKSTKNEFLSKTIDEMVKIDQASRKNAKENMLNEGQTIYNHIVYLIDTINGLKIKEMIKQFGYPTKTMIGEMSMKNFWLLVQHQDLNLDLQMQCLKKCDFDSRNKAYLADRVLVNSGKKQLYGTQFYKDENGVLKPRPIQDHKNIDKRRKKMGMEPLEEYTKTIQEVN